MPQTSDNRWYLAYGSSISSRFLLKQGIVPLASHVVRVPHAKLLFNVHFLPFWEPVLANLEINQPTVSFHGSDDVYSIRDSVKRSPSRRDSKDSKGSRERSSSVIGVAYLLTAEDYRRFVALESSGTPYVEAVVKCYPLFKGLANAPSSPSEVGGRSRDTDIQILAYTLVSKQSPYPNNSKPSKRYMDSMIYGAIEHRFPAEYRRTLAEIPYDEMRGLRIIPAIIFLSLWIIPLFITLAFHETFAPEQGRSFIASLCRAPYRGVMNIMWMQYRCVWEDLCEDNSGRMMRSSPFNKMGSRRGLPLLSILRSQVHSHFQRYKAKSRQ